MSLRNALRSRFRSDKDKEKEGACESRDTSPWRVDPAEDEAAGSVNCKNANASPEEDSVSIVSSSSGSDSKRVVFSAQGGPESRGSFRDVDEKSVYEMQLNHLQEQLVAAMIENQNLSRELTSYKEKHEVDRIMKDLEYEKQRNQQLIQQLDEAKQNRSWSLRKRKLQRASTEPVDTDVRSGDSDVLSSDWVDVAQEATEGLVDQPELESSPSRSPRIRNLQTRLHEWLIHTFYELMADFTEEPETETPDDGEGDPLTVKKLKENIKRFRNDAKPIVSTVKGIQRLLLWRAPSVTLLAFMVYMYSVWIGWFLPVMLFLAIFKLSLNYLQYKGWNINLVMLAEPEEDDRSKDSDAFKDLGMSDKFNLVVQVARQVQNMLGKLGDNLEKLKNLMMWRHPDSTLRLYTVLCVGFVLSAILPGTTLFTIGALYMGIKMFIIEYIFTRFPRIKRRHDSTYLIWKSLPTDAALEKQYQKAAIDRVEDISESIKKRVHFGSVLTARPIEDTTTSDGERVTDDDKTFCELFNLPMAEHPLPGWRGGRRCTLINKDKSLTAAFKHGKLFLTRSFLCFERSKTTANKNIVIPLTEVARIEKAKPYAWMPGGGMSIEVTVLDQDKPYMFGAILNRDECFDSIIANGIKGNLPWAIEISSGASSSGTSSPTATTTAIVTDCGTASAEVSTAGNMTTTTAVTATTTVTSATTTTTPSTKTDQPASENTENGNPT